MPRRQIYGFIANKEVTERLVDPALMKVECREILDQCYDVLFTPLTMRQPGAGLPD
jgi:hypothetical protein